MDNKNKQELYDFAGKCVLRLGDIVREMNIDGEKIGLTKEEIKKVWRTVFVCFT